MKHLQIPTGPTTFRHDINGLRALAVTAVVLYHFGIGGLQGGFAGVDVFFVISGFLMTSIIVEGLQQNRFSILSFYWSRARRIWPALIVVCIAVLIVGWVLLSPEDYKALGRHARQSLVFLSNKLYLKEAGYFDGAAQGKWLLHTWSLSVEWQFYLLLPLLLTAIWKLLPNRTAIFAAHLLLFAASLATCILITRTAPEQAFYLLQSRAWEMLLGGLCYLLGCATLWPAVARRGLEAGGLLLIIGSAFLLDSNLAWPGYFALLPTLGTAMVLYAHQKSSFWCSNPVTQWLGSRSYSLYLWHWPLVAALYCFDLQGAVPWIAAAIALSLALSELSYRLVEQPARHGLQRWRRRWAVAGLLGLVLLTGFAANEVVKNKGIPQRLPENVASMLERAKTDTPRKEDCLVKGAACDYGGADIRLLLIGDSHASAVVGGVVAALPSPNQGIRLHASAACLPVPGLHNREHPPQDQSDPCNQLIAQLPAELASIDSSLPLIIVNRTSAYPFGYNRLDRIWKAKPLSYKSAPYDAPTPESLQEFSDEYVASVCTLAKTRPVYLMRPLPELQVMVPEITARNMLKGNYSSITISREDYQKRHQFVWQVQDRAREQCGVTVLDPLPYLCDEQRCYGSKDGKPLYMDDNHLNQDGAALLAPMFAKALGLPPHPTEPVTAIESPLQGR
jgi:peptidoglycan/LPS O-acetylase OafA/YrhL